MSDEYAAHDDEDEKLLGELAQLRRLGTPSEREREIIGELISGWEPHFWPWLVIRIGRDDGDEVASRVVLRLVQLLRRQHEFTAAWGAVVWRIVKDEAYRFYRARDKRPEKLVADVHANPEAEPYEEPLDGLDLDPDNDARRFLGLLSQLSERDRRIIELTVLDERPRAEAAALLGIKVGALDTAKHRALERLAGLAARDGVSEYGDLDEREL